MCVLFPRGNGMGLIKIGVFLSQVDHQSFLRDVETWYQEGAWQLKQMHGNREEGCPLPSETPGPLRPRPHPGLQPPVPPV